MCQEVNTAAHCGATHLSVHQRHCPLAGQGRHASVGEGQLVWPLDFDVVHCSLPPTRGSPKSSTYRLVDRLTVRVLGLNCRPPNSITCATATAEIRLVMSVQEASIILSSFTRRCTGSAYVVICYQPSTPHCVPCQSIQAKCMAVVVPTGQ